MSGAEDFAAIGKSGLNNFNPNPAIATSLHTKLWIRDVAGKENTASATRIRRLFILKSQVATRAKKS